ncbi:MAG: ATP-binding protein [Blastocatellia bacterium]
MSLTQDMTTAAPVADPAPRPDMARPPRGAELEIHIFSDPAHIPCVISLLDERAVTAGVIAADDEEFRMSLREALINAMLHGNKGEHVCRVVIRAEISAARARVSIADEGAGFDPCAVPDARAPDRLLLPTGRGILLMRHYMDEVRWNAAGNEVTLVRYTRDGK